MEERTMLEEIERKTRDGFFIVTIKMRDGSKFKAEIKEADQTGMWTSTIETESGDAAWRAIPWQAVDYLEW